jgi:hypothetical protein
MWSSKDWLFGGALHLPGGLLVPVTIGKIHSCGLWQCRYQPVFRFVECSIAMAIFTGLYGIRRLRSLIGHVVVGSSSGLRHSCAAAVEVVSGGPSDGPVHSMLVEEMAVPLLWSAVPQNVAVVEPISSSCC